MADIPQYIKRVLSSKNLEFNGKKGKLFDEFAADKDNILLVQQIMNGQDTLIKKYMYKSKIYNIIDQHLQIPNATVGKPYKFTLNIAALGEGNITQTGMEGLDEYGLSYDADSYTISGTPTQSGDFKVRLLFHISEEREDAPFNVKPVSLIINADPKSLWKTIASDEGKDEEWKQKCIVTHPTPTFYKADAS